MDEAVKAFQEIIPRSNMDTTLSGMENFKLLMLIPLSPMHPI